MIRWVILAVLIVAVAAVVPLAVNYLPADVSGSVPASRPSDEPSGPPPSAVVEGEATHDFGLMSEQDEGTRTWVLRNDGEGPLRVRFLEKPCTCTGVRLGEGGRPFVEGETLDVGPGEQAELTIAWETRDQIGEFSTFARFASNDYEHNPTITLTVKGVIAPAVVVDPSRIDFNAAPSDSESTRSAMIFSPTHPEMALTSEPKSSRPGLLVADVRPLTSEELEQFNAARLSQLVGHDHAEGEAHDHDHPEADQMPRVTAGFLVTATLKPGLPLGRFVDAITIKTDHPIRPEVEIPVSGLVVGPIAAVPERVYMPGVSSRDGRATTVRLNVRNHDSTRFTPRIPDSLRGLVDVAIEPVGTVEEGAPFRQYRVEIRVPAGAKPGIHRGTVVLETDHPQAQEVKVPVELIIRAG